MEVPPAENSAAANIGSDSAAAMSKITGALAASAEESTDQVDFPAPVSVRKNKKKAASSAKVKVSKTALVGKLKYASEAELKAFIRGLSSSHPDVIADSFPSFRPVKMPVVPTADDPIMKSCFHCESKDNLKKCYGVKVCDRCNSAMYNHENGKMSRHQVMAFFDFNAIEAEYTIPHTKTDGYAYFGVLIKPPTYTYTYTTVIKAVETKFGSLYCMVRKRRNDRLSQLQLKQSTAPSTPVVGSQLQLQVPTIPSTPVVGSQLQLQAPTVPSASGVGVVSSEDGDDDQNANHSRMA